MAGLTALAIGASAVGGLAQAGAARSAASSQEAAAREQIAAAERNAQLIRGDLAVYRNAGAPAQNALNFELGLGSKPDGYNGFELSPYASYAIEKGRDSIEAGASYGGGLYSGRTLQALDQDRMGRAQADRNGFLDRLTGVANSGQNAAAQSGAASTNSTNAAINALGSIGDAQSSAAIATGNAFSGFLSDGIGTLQYQNMLDRGFPIASQQAQPTMFGGMPSRQSTSNAFMSGIY